MNTIIKHNRNFYLKNDKSIYRIYIQNDIKYTIWYINNCLKYCTVEDKDLAQVWNGSDLFVLVKIDDEILKFEIGLTSA